MAQQVKALEMAKGTLVGDCRDGMLQAVKLCSNWDKAPESQQNTIINSLDKQAEEMVKRAVEIIAADGRDYIHGAVHTITLSGTRMRIVLDAPLNEDNLLLAGMRSGSSMLLVMARPEDFDGERAPAKATPQQGELIKD